MKIHLISVGVSLFDNLATRSDYRRHVKAASEVLGRDVEAVRESLRVALTMSDDPIHQKITDLVALLQPASWSSGLSAELQSFDGHLHDDELAVLVCSDTADGLTAGLWNALGLVGGDINRIKYIDDAHTWFKRTSGQVNIARIPGMHIGSDSGFREAMRAMGSLGRTLVCKKPGDSTHFHVHCHLSGGYKAAIPCLIGLAEGLNGLNHVTVRATVRHETNPTEEITIPLRRLPSDLVEKELGGPPKDESGNFTPRSDRFEGYLYEKHGRTCQLTPFGEGLCALLFEPIVANCQA